jgi:early secretory antigenic target protein ESAT-6
MSGHRADLDEMRRVVDTLAGRLSLLEELADRLTRGVAALESTWTGEASTSHEAARARWDAGFAQMRDALGDMRAVVRAARDHYESAAESNLVRWRALG